jgi:hypothetical protein
LPLFSNFALEYAIWKTQANQDGLILNATHQILVLADMLDRSIHTIKKNKDTVVVPSKGAGLEVNAENTKHITCLETSKQTESHHKDR